MSRALPGRHPASGPLLPGMVAIVLTIAAIGCDRGAAEHTSPPAEEIPPLDERATLDRPDPAPGPLVHVVYAVCSDCPDREMDVKGVLSRSLEVVQDFLERETGLAIRWDVYDGGADVTFLRIDASRDEIASLGVSAVGRFLEALDRAGLDEEDKKYLVVYEGHSSETCGAARQGGSAAIVFVGPNDRSCPRAFALRTMGVMEYNMLHELLHALDFVDPDAPNHTESDPHHVDDDPADIMYSGSEAWRPTAVDPGGDDYMGPRVPEGVRQLWESRYFVGAVSGGG